MPAAVAVACVPVHVDRAEVWDMPFTSPAFLRICRIHPHLACSTNIPQATRALVSPCGLTHVPNPASRRHTAKFPTDSTPKTGIRHALFPRASVRGNPRTSAGSAKLPLARSGARARSVDQVLDYVPAWTWTLCGMCVCWRRKVWLWLGERFGKQVGGGLRCLSDFVFRRLRCDQWQGYEEREGWNIRNAAFERD
ncbi:hypothetical protein K505DRAFT_381579 [Melanomma pulvis-pyrius CBS 109.77]|uniref:Uncharacterized protein n=1 Tax=Melanomma pulvis-pyrius CBS 109.77 TaxID=1314802 RepID=A0A6A6XHK3_9PLEO|nr:hypothetical protein K505DRAFT_381579 [Melanomma pulvis-pyrius CBS 109.77]